MLIDTHCHLDDEIYDNDREEIIKNFKGIIINCGTNLKTSKNSIELAKTYKNIYPTIGIHPHYAKDADFSEIESLLDSYHVVAIGECGLDFYRNPCLPDIQEGVFRNLIHIANERNLPLIIHSREAMEETLRIIKEENVKKGVFHSFNGESKDISKILDLGLFISITGVITFKNSKLKDIVPLIPKTRIMFETDAPYLAPHPFRGQRNRPDYIQYVIRGYANACGIRFEEAAEINYNNAKALFSL